MLFLDEAYSLARRRKDLGKKLDTMVKAMEDHKDNFILILAGYKEEMKWFLQTNRGYAHAFRFILIFPDYSMQELLAIAEQMLRQRQYHLTEEAKRTGKYFVS